MGKFRSILLLCLGFLLVHVRGQRDFDLADALDHPEDIITRKPTVVRRPTRPVLNNDLHLGDALGGGDIPRKPLYPPLPPRPGSHSNSGGFDDSDLLDGKPLPPHVTGEEEHNFNHGGNTDSGLIAGVTSPIISAFVILVVGSIAAYSAYKNKRLCFKPHGGVWRSFTGISERSGILQHFRKPQPGAAIAGSGVAAAGRVPGEGLGSVTQGRFSRITARDVSGEARQGLKAVCALRV
ncbi:PREDICTED: glycoprotein Xg [Aptenodytes forsteri]|uniref:glycoprotein Xg n=1 Tax=Aptenodytes forsteri TaxID=9233 RepID=UPI000905157F|nr:PREDICTED: glycoprotein Xg [Aptenodytes forsteri]